MVLSLKQLRACLYCGMCLCIQSTNTHSGPLLCKVSWVLGLQGSFLFWGVWTTKQMIRRRRDVSIDRNWAESARSLSVEALEGDLPRAETSDPKLMKPRANGKRQEHVRHSKGDKMRSHENRHMAVPKGGQQLTRKPVHSRESQSLSVTQAC